MASDGETSCVSDPNFAIICSFFERFGVQCGLKCPDFLELQEMLDNTQELAPDLVDLHLKLLRKIKKSVTTDRWEKTLIKVCHTFSSQDAWEVERFGYKKARTSSKVRILKALLEMQFDYNVKFKSEINKLTSKELRNQPIGRDKSGNCYWYLIDDQCQIRVYREDPDEETWTVVAKNREGLVNLIRQLASGEVDCKDLDSNLNEDSNSLETEKPITDTGQVSTSASVVEDESSASADGPKDANTPPTTEQEETISPKDEKPEETSEPPESSELRKPEIQKIRLLVKNLKKIEPEVTEDVMDLTSKKKKSIEDLAENLKNGGVRSVMQDRGVSLSIVRNKDAVKSALKLPGYEGEEEGDEEDDDFDDEFEEINLPSHMKQPRLDRPKLLGSKNYNKPPSEEEEDGEEFEDEIEEPVMYVQGEGAGKECESGNTGNDDEYDVIEEDVMYFYGEGTGRECETGNEEKPETEKNSSAVESEKGSTSSIPSPTNKIGKVVFDSDNQLAKNDKSPKKSRWDVKTDDNCVDKEHVDAAPFDSDKDETKNDAPIFVGKVKNLISRWEEISSPSGKKDETDSSSKSMFFFGPQSMNFNTSSFFKSKVPNDTNKADNDKRLNENTNAQATETALGKLDSSSNNLGETTNNTSIANKVGGDNNEEMTTKLNKLTVNNDEKVLESSSTEALLSEIEKFCAGDSGVIELSSKDREMSTEKLMDELEKYTKPDEVPEIKDIAQQNNNSENVFSTNACLTPEDSQDNVKDETLPEKTTELPETLPNESSNKPKSTTSLQSTDSNKVEENKTLQTTEKVLTENGDKELSSNDIEKEITLEEIKDKVETSEESSQKLETLTSEPTSVPDDKTISSDSIELIDTSEKIEKSLPSDSTDKQSEESEISIEKISEKLDVSSESTEKQSEETVSESIETLSETLPEKADMEESAKDSLLEEVTKEALPEEITKEVLPEEHVKETLSEETATETLSEETATETLSEETATETLSEETVTETLSEEATTEALPEETAVEKLSNEAVTEALPEEVPTEAFPGEVTKETLPEKATTEELLEKATTKNSTDESVTETEPEETTKETLPEIATEESLLQENTKETLPEKATEESLLQENTKETLQDEATEKALPNSTNEAEEAINEVLPEEVVKEVIPEETTKEVISEEVTKEIIPEEATKEVISDVITKEVLPEEATNKALPEEVTKEKATEEVSKKPLSEETTTESVTDEVATGSLLEEDTTEAVVDEVATESEVATKKELSYEVTTDKLSEKTTTESLPEETTNALLDDTVPEENTIKTLPNEETNEALPEEATTEALPEKAVTKPLLKEATTESLPKEATTEALPEEATSEALPERDVTKPLLEEATTEALPKEATTEVLPEQATAEALSEKDTTKSLSEETTEEFLEKATTEAALEDAKTEVLLDETQTEELLDETKTGAVPEKATTEPLPEEITTEVVPEKATTEALKETEVLPEETKTEAPSEKAEIEVFLEESTTEALHNEEVTEETKMETLTEDKLANQKTVSEKQIPVGETLSNTKESLNESQTAQDITEEITSENVSMPSSEEAMETNSESLLISSEETDVSEERDVTTEEINSNIISEDSLKIPSDISIPLEEKIIAEETQKVSFDTEKAPSDVNSVKVPEETVVEVTEENKIDTEVPEKETIADIGTETATEIDRAKKDVPFDEKSNEIDTKDVTEATEPEISEEKPEPEPKSATELEPKVVEEKEDVIETKQSIEVPEVPSKLVSESKDEKVKEQRVVSVKEDTMKEKSSESKEIEQETDDAKTLESDKEISENQQVVSIEKEEEPAEITPSEKIKVTEQITEKITEIPVETESVPEEVADEKSVTPSEDIEKIKDVEKTPPVEVSPSVETLTETIKEDKPAEVPETTVTPPENKNDTSKEISPENETVIATPSEETLKDESVEEKILTTPSEETLESEVTQKEVSTTASEKTLISEITETTEKVATASSEDTLKTAEEGNEEEVVNESSSTTHVSPSMSDGPILCEDSTSNEAASLPNDEDDNAKSSTENKENVMPPVDTANSPPKCQAKEIISIEEVDDAGSISESSLEQVVLEAEVPEIKISKNESVSIEEIPPQEVANIPPEMVLGVKSPNVEVMSEDSPRVEEKAEADSKPDESCSEASFHSARSDLEIKPIVSGTKSKPEEPVVTVDSVADKVAEENSGKENEISCTSEINSNVTKPAEPAPVKSNKAADKNIIEHSDDLVPICDNKTIDKTIVVRENNESVTETKSEKISDKKPLKSVSEKLVENEKNSADQTPVDVQVENLNHKTTEKTDVKKTKPSLDIKNNAEQNHNSKLSPKLSPKIAQDEKTVVNDNKKRKLSVDSNDIKVESEKPEEKEETKPSLRSTRSRSKQELLPGYERPGPKCSKKKNKIVKEEILVKEEIPIKVEPKQVEFAKSVEVKITKIEIETPLKLKKIKDIKCDIKEQKTEPKPEALSTRLTRSRTRNPVPIVEKPKPASKKTKKEPTPKKPVEKPKTETPKVEAKPVEIISSDSDDNGCLGFADDDIGPTRSDSEDDIVTDINLSQPRVTVVDITKLQGNKIENNKSNSPIVINDDSTDIGNADADPLASPAEEKPKKTMTLSTFSLDTEEVDTTNVFEPIRRSLRRRQIEVSPLETNRKRARETQADNADATDAKKRKMRNKRPVDAELRKSIEEQKNKENVSSDEEEEKDKPKEEEKKEEQPKKTWKKGKRGKKLRGCAAAAVAAASVNVEVTPTAPNQDSPAISSDADTSRTSATATPTSVRTHKRKKRFLGLELDPSVIIPEKGEDDASGKMVRQSRRIAQIKIKEEAERRKLEEFTVIEQLSKKKKNKKNYDKDYKIDKKKTVYKETTEEEDEEMEEDFTKKKKKKRKHQDLKRLFNISNAWKSSSDSSSTAEEEEEEEVEDYEEEDVRKDLFKSDHEFSPESDIEDTAEVQPTRRARTVKKESDSEEPTDDQACQKCGKSDHPEFILLCDSCDNGWHCSCLRPALFVIPEGDWFCPPCQHLSLISALKEQLIEYDKAANKLEIEQRRKERLAYVGISLANVLPAKVDGERKRPENETDSESDSSSSSSGSSSGDESEPIYQLRERRQAHSYRFNDYDDLINSAIQEEVEIKGAGNQGRGKDISTIVNAEKEEQAAQAKAILEAQLPPPQEPQEEQQEQVEPPVETTEAPVAELEEPPPVVPARTEIYELKSNDIYSDDDPPTVSRKLKGRKKHRKLNCLDDESEEDNPDSDEDFKGDSDSEEDVEEDLGSDSDDSFEGRRRGSGPIRRSSRARTTRYDREFINDDSEDEPVRKKYRSIWDESETESDKSWGRRKKKKQRSSNREVIYSSKKRKRSKKKKKRNSDSDTEVKPKVKRPRIKYGGLDDSEEEIIVRRTRGKKMTYVDTLGSDSEDEKPKKAARSSESEEEYVANDDDEEDELEAEAEMEMDQEQAVVEDKDDSGGESGNDKPPVVPKKIIKLAKVPKSPRARGRGRGICVLQRHIENLSITSIKPPPPVLDDSDIPALGEEDEGEEEEEEEEEEGRVGDFREIEGEGVPQTDIPVIAANPEGMDDEEVGMMMEEEEFANKQLELMAIQLAKEKKRKEMEAQLNVMQPVVNTGEEPKKRGRRKKYVEGASPLKQQLQQQLTVPPMIINKALINPVPLEGEREDSMEESPVPTTVQDLSLTSPAKRRGRGKGKKTIAAEAAAAAVAAGVGSPISGDSQATNSPEPGFHGGKLGIATPPQPFTQSQPTPSVITRMLQSQPVSAQPFAAAASAMNQKYFGMDQSRGASNQFPGMAAAGRVPSPYRQNVHGVNNFPNVRPLAPDSPHRLRSPGPANLPQMFHSPHHPLDPSPSGGGIANNPRDTQSPADKGGPTPPPPQYPRGISRFPNPEPPGPSVPTVRPPHHMPFPTQMQPDSPPRPPAPTGNGNFSPYHPPPPPNYHYGAYPPPPSLTAADDALPPTQYQSSPYPEPYNNPPDSVSVSQPSEGSNSKTFDEEGSGEFGGLVSYFSSQREDDLDA